MYIKLARENAEESYHAGIAFMEVDRVSQLSVPEISLKFSGNPHD
jgi:hypothetical protein